jgi:hypothetical protein
MSNPALAVPVLRYLAAAVAMAEAARGVREEGVNSGKDVRAYLADCDPPIHAAAPWCAAFVQYCTDRASKGAGITNPLDDVKREAYVPDYFELAKVRGWQIPHTLTDVGDLVLFQWATGPRRWNHIGIVAQPPNKVGAFWTIEGNTSSGEEGDQREGEGVYHKVRTVASTYRTCFIRWDRDATVPPGAHLKMAA